MASDEWGKLVVKSVICVITILGLFFLCLWIYVCNTTNRVNRYMEKIYSAQQDVKINKIPKVLWLTYPNKTQIPQKVWENLHKYAGDFDIYVYDDHDGLEFIRRNFDSTVVDKYNALSGAHKADLLRYCLLYVHGGVYMDIKTELIRPLTDLITTIIPRGSNRYPIISVLSNFIPNTIYQGVIITPPRRGLFLGLIEFILQTSHMLPKIYYFAFVKNFYAQVKLDVGHELKPGLNVGKRDTYYLLEENCTKNSGDCYDGLDRYGLCCFITDQGHKVIKTRYADYPWTSSKPFRFHLFWDKISRPGFWILTGH